MMLRATGRPISRHAAAAALHPQSSLLRQQARTSAAGALVTAIRHGGRSRKKESSLGDLPNPFADKPLPFDKVLFKTDWWEDMLKAGHGWLDRDRIGKWHDSYFMEETYQDSDDSFAHPYPDLLYPWDDDFQYKVTQLEMMIDMMKEVPDLARFVPELMDELAKFHVTGLEQLKQRVDEIARADDSTKGAAYMRQAAGEMVEFNPEPSKNDNTADWLHKVQDLVDEAWVNERIDERDFIRLQFIDAMGKKYLVYGMVGESLLETCRRWEIPIDGLCQGGDKTALYGEGACCYWCQVDLAPTYWHLVPPMLYTELHHHYHMRTHTPTSRLACQVRVQKDFDGMLVSIPHNNPSLNGRDGGYWN